MGLYAGKEIAADGDAIIPEISPCRFTIREAKYGFAFPNFAIFSGAARSAAELLKNERGKLLTKGCDDVAGSCDGKRR